MAAKTFTSAGVNNLWSNPANWDLTTLPVDNDSVTIPLGQTCEFDVDTSAWANGIAGITITGTLKLTRTPGVYYLKMKAATTINGAGTFDCGTSGSILPFASKHTITGGSGWYIQGNGGMTMTVYTTEPTKSYVKLTQQASAGATRLYVDGDLTADLWQVGDTIHIANVNKTKDLEVRTIAAIAPTYIDISAGLTATKLVNTVIADVNRHVKFTAAASGNICSGFANTKLVVSGGEWSIGTILNNCSGAVIHWGSFRDASYIGNNNTNTVINNGLFSNDNTLDSSAIFVNGMVMGLIYATAYEIRGGNFYGNFYPGAQLISGGMFYGNYSNSWQKVSVIAGGTFQNNGAGLGSSYAEIKNAILTGNNFDINGWFKAYNTLFGSTAEVSGYTSLPKEQYCESIDHDQVAGAYKAWTRGGVTSPQATTLPTGYTTAMQTVLENAAVEGYWQKEYTIGAGASIKFTSNLRKHDSMTYLPRVQIFNKALADPFAGGTPLHTFTMTDSIDTWESEVWTYTNSTSADVTLVVRVQGMAASGTIYHAVKAEVINVDLTTALANIATIDTVVDAIQAKTDQLAFTTANQVDANALSGVLDSTVEGTYTLQDVLKVMAAVLAGKVTGGGTTSITFRDLSDTLDRVVATVDSSGNRSDVTKTLT